MSECFAGVCSNYYFIITFFPLLRFVLCFYVLNAFVVIAAAVAAASAVVAAAGAPQTFLSQQKFAYVCIYVCIYWSVCMCACACLWRGEHVRACTCIWLCLCVCVCIVRNQQGWRQTSCCVPPLTSPVVVVGGYVFAWFDHFSAATAAEQSSSVGSRRPCAYFWLTIATVCASASERVRDECVRILLRYATLMLLCYLSASPSRSLCLLLPLSFPDALNYLIIVRYFFCSFWLSLLSLEHVCVCVYVHACECTCVLLFSRCSFAS